MKRLLQTAALAMGLVFALALIGPAGAAPDTLVVDDDGVQCPGADFTSISAAVAAADPGDTIQVCPGTYSESVTVDKTLKLVGAKDGLTAAQCVAGIAGFPATDPTKWSVVNPPGAANGIVVTAANVKIEKFVVDDSDGGAGIKLVGASRAEVKKNVVQDNTIGVQALGASDSKVKDNCIRENNKAGAAGGNGFYSDAALTDVKIENNDFFSNKSAAVNVVAPGGGTNVIVKHNRSTDDGTAVSFEGTTRSVISHNSATLCDGGCIDIRGGNTALVIEHNKLFNGDDEGIAINAGPNTGLVIRHNQILNNATDGLNPAAGGTLMGSEISNNRVKGNAGKGIWVELGNSGNTLAHNDARGNAGTDCQDDNPPGTNTWAKKNRGSESAGSAVCKP